LGELGVSDCVSMHLYGERESLSPTCFPGPSTSEMCIKRVHNSPHKRSDSPSKDPTVVIIARKEYAVRKRYAYLVRSVAPKCSLSSIPGPNDKVE
jgi:hypothetical protein